MAQVMVLDRNEFVRAVLGDGPSACPILEDLHRETLANAAISYQFTVPADHPDAQAIEPEGYVLFRDLDGLLLQLRIKVVEDAVGEEGGQRVRKVFCENAALELNGAIVRPQTWTGVTASQALANALAGTRWQPGVVEWVGAQTIKIEDYQTVTATLHQIASTFGAELRWRVEWKDGRIVARYVDLLQRRGRDTGARFEYTQDIQGLRRVEDSTELVTAMIGLGKSDDQGRRLTFADVEWSTAAGKPVNKPKGQDWVGDPEALSRWGLPDGRHLFGVFEDPDESDPAMLLQKTWDALQQRIQGRFSYEVDVAVLERIAGLEHNAVRLGDTVTIHDVAVTPPMVLQARVVEIERSYVDPSRDKVILGQYQQLSVELPKVVVSLQKRLNQKQGEWDAKQDRVHQGPQPPENPQDGQMWLDTKFQPNVLWRWDAVADQWVKVTPTEAQEVKAETPEGAQAKAEAAENNAKTFAQLAAAQAEQSAKAHADQQAATAESNAKSYADTVAAQAEQNAKNAVAGGEVPLPTSALQGVLDAARNAIESKAAFVYWDGNGIIVYDKAKDQNPTKAVRIGAGGILVADSKDANGNWNWRTAITGTGIVADEVNTGTLKGVNIELGGAGNGNGLLVVRDASGLERARLDNEGVAVTEGHFLLHDAITQVPSSIAHATNLVRDHSFETIPRTGAPDSHQTYLVDTTQIGDPFWWWFSGAESPRILSTYGAGAGQLARFDFQAAVLRYWDRTMWRQRVPLDQTVGLAGPYTFSAWFAAFSATTADTTAYGELRAVDANGASFQTVGSFTVPIKASEKWVWKRGYVTVRNLPANTAYLEIRLYCVPDSMILCDGVQIVPLDRPAVYDPESALWRSIRELPGYRRAEQLPRVRLTRTSNFAIPQSTPTALAWQARRGGYTTANFWDPNQSDRTIVYIPESGLYIVTVNVRWQASASGYRGITIQKNGSINIAKEQLPAAAVQDTYQEVTTVHLFNAGDTVKVIVVHNSSDGTLSIIKEDEVSPELTIARIF